MCCVKLRLYDVIECQSGACLGEHTDLHPEVGLRIDGTAHHGAGPADRFVQLVVDFHNAHGCPSPLFTIYDSYMNRSLGSQSTALVSDWFQADHGGAWTRLWAISDRLLYSDDGGRTVILNGVKGAPSPHFDRHRLIFRAVTRQASTMLQTRSWAGARTGQSNQAGSWLTPGAGFNAWPVLP